PPRSIKQRNNATAEWRRLRAIRSFRVNSESERNFWLVLRLNFGTQPVYLAVRLTPILSFSAHSPNQINSSAGIPFCESTEISRCRRRSSRNNSRAEIKEWPTKSRSRTETEAARAKEPVHRWWK